MSVFDLLRGKISDVQQDLSKSFKSLRKKQKQLKKHPKTETVDLNAGADLLFRSQKQWEELSEASEINANKADEAAVEIGSLFQTAEHKWQGLSTLVTLVSTLPQLLDSVKAATTQIDEIGQTMQGIEDDLTELEDLCERCELQNNQLHHQYQLSIYLQRKNTQLEEVKVDLARKHAKKVQGYEAKLQEMMKQRQQAFDEVFREEMQYYKQFGQTQRKPNERASKDVDISEIALEDDTSALDEFLQSDDITQDDPSKKGDGKITETDASQDDEEEADESESDSAVVITPDEDPTYESTNFNSNTKEITGNYKPESANFDSNIKEIPGKFNDRTEEKITKNKILTEENLKVTDIKESDSVKVNENNNVKSVES